MFHVVTSISQMALAPRKPLDYTTAVKKGHKLLLLMRSPKPPLVSQKFTVEDIGKYGYELRRYGCDDDFEYYNSMLTSLGTYDYVRAVVDKDNMGGDNIDMALTHKTDVVISGVLILKTHACFDSVLNIKAGLFIAMNNITSEAKRMDYMQSARDGHLPPLPALRHWSDIAFLQWSLLPSLIISTPPLTTFFVLELRTMTPLPSYTRY